MMPGKFHEFLMSACPLSNNTTIKGETIGSTVAFESKNNQLYNNVKHVRLHRVQSSICPPWKGRRNVGTCQQFYMARSPCSHYEMNDKYLGFNSTIWASFLNLTYLPFQSTRACFLPLCAGVTICRADEFQTWPCSVSSKSTSFSR